jgi:hypothetical protein
MIMKLSLKILGLLGTLGIILAAYLFWARPYQLHWGATPTEINRSLPGDELHGQPDFLATRAITIQAPPEEIWPWLIQMGYERAGFYGYDLLENLGSQRGLLSAETILPEFQDFQVGDVVPISRVSELYFAAIEPNRYLVWSSLDGEDPGAFAWALFPDGPNQTRLISRVGWSYHQTEPAVLALEVFTEFADHIAIRKILQGIKGRVEGQTETFARQNLEFGVLMLPLVGFLASLLLFIFRPLSWQTWGASLAAGGIWLATWYAPLPLWGRGLLAPLVLIGLGWAYQISRDKRKVSKGTPRA